MNSGYFTYLCNSRLINVILMVNFILIYIYKLKNYISEINKNNLYIDLYMIFQRITVNLLNTSLPF